MQELLDRLLAAGFDTARMAGPEIHLTAYRVPLVISEGDGRFTVRAAADNVVARSCRSADEVIVETKRLARLSA